MIVPAQLPRSENRLAEFARFSTHIYKRNVMTSSHGCKLMRHTYMEVCACVISGVRAEDINILGERTCETLSKGKCVSINDNRTNTTCMPGVSPFADSFVTLCVCAARSSAEYAGDWGCLFTHDVQTIVGIRKETLPENIGFLLWFLCSRCKRLVIIVLPFSCPTKDTLQRLRYTFSDATKGTNTHRSSLSTRHSSATMCILPTMPGRAEHTTVCMLEQFHKEHVIAIGHHEIAQHVIRNM